MDGNDSDNSDIVFLKEEHFVKYSASVSHHSEITSCPQQSTENKDNQSGNYTNPTHST